MSENSSRVEPTARLPVLTENAWIATIVVAFLILHILTGAFLVQHASETSAITLPEQATSILYD